MIQLILGILLLSIPFILVTLFDDKKKGFIYILFFLFFFQSFLGLLTQLLGIFYYQVIIGATLIVDLVLIFIYFKIKNKVSAKGGSASGRKKIDWVILFVTIVSLLTLYQVHFNYTGEINIATDYRPSYHEVKNMEYVYPYFSDEWYAVSLVQGAIENHSLPVNNLLNNKFFPNLELFFHSFIAQIMLLLGLNPLLNYTILSIFINTLIILLMYLFLRLSDISRLSAGIASLLALYIPSGANIPGFWHLIPLSSGILFFLFTLCFMKIGNIKISTLGTILACLFYPPLAPFYLLAWLVFLYSKSKDKKKALKLFSKIAIVSVIVAPIIYSLTKAAPFSKTIDYLLSRIFFEAFSAPFISQIYFFDIIPILSILLLTFGLYFLVKNKKWILLSTFILGILYWFLYSLSTYRFFAEYERIVILTSIIIVIISGFGLKQIENYIKEKDLKIFKMAEIAILLSFLILIPFYTKANAWKKIVAIDPQTKIISYPKSVANNYLTEEDLKLFSDIKDKRFLSIPWKGTVIGVATRNNPIVTKQGTISIGSNSVIGKFLGANCNEKKNMAKDLKLDYIYLNEYDCPNFVKIGQSSEGFYLYKFLNE